MAQTVERGDEFHAGPIRCLDDAPGFLAGQRGLHRQLGVRGKPIAVTDLQNQGVHSLPRQRVLDEADQQRNVVRRRGHQVRAPHRKGLRRKGVQRRQREAEYPW
jgi:hypothetical protein